MPAADRTSAAEQVERIEAALDCLLRAALEHRGARSPAIIGT